MSNYFQISRHLQPGNAKIQNAINMKQQCLLEPILG